MPLIRYRVGDYGTLSPDEATCNCGRTLPILSGIEGRMDETLYTADGRRIGRLDTVFKSQLPLREAQIIQETLESIRVRYVPTEDWTHSSSAILTERLQSHMGDIRVVLEPVDKIPRGANGKFRAVVCDLPQTQKESLESNRIGVGVD
jgi:phenylacetate-CoA ligase